MSIKWGHTGFLSLLNFDAHFARAQASTDVNIGIHWTKYTQSFLQRIIMHMFITDLWCFSFPVFMPPSQWPLLRTSPKETLWTVSKCLSRDIIGTKSVLPQHLQEAWVAHDALQSWEDLLSPCFAVLFCHLGPEVTLLKSRGSQVVSGKSSLQLLQIYLSQFMQSNRDT